ncbi:MAG TPA: class I SAM-dependent methyltransferase [Verrucomicrobiae bacterium]|nr:class I SAM-dependent methyltransferase [Verrucomicrobiae bacterium]
MSDDTATGTVLIGETDQGTAIRGSVVRLSRFQVLFETYSPAALVKTSQVISEVKIMAENRTLYSGRAVVSHIANAGSVLLCEATLEEGWIDVDFFTALADVSHLSEQFDHFIRGWQKTYKIAPEYKLIVADMQTFLMELRGWLDQVELGVRSSPSGDRAELERELLKAVAKPILPCIDTLFERFEAIAATVDKELQPAHWNYMRRQLHSLVLCCPFAYRTFAKPLGYAGDYEMVNMIARDPLEGSTLFAKILNLWFLEQVPARAHRNRIVYLKQKIFDEALRVASQRRPTRIFNLGCGPALEIQQFLAEHGRTHPLELTLVDFSDESLEHLRALLETINRQHNLTPAIRIQKRSVMQILKEAAHSVELPPDKRYDLIYCAGLFDYLPDLICQRLSNIFYNWLAPGGLMLVTNVDPSNPMRYGMEHLLDWFLVYRSASQARALKPEKARLEDFAIIAENTGANIFLEVRNNHA